MLGNAMAALLVSMAIRVLDISFLSITYATVLSVTAFLVMSWMACIVCNYVQELEVKYKKLSYVVLGLWGIVFESCVLLALFQFHLIS